MFTLRQYKIGVLIFLSLTFFYFIPFKTIKSNAAFKGLIFDKKSSKIPVYQFHSKCDCRKNENITLYKQNVIENSTLYDVVSTLNNFYYTVKEDQLDDLVCGAYETLRRGHHQKVIGYSLYGTNDFYTEYLTSKSLRNLFQTNNCFFK
jgi:hypothetical protein